MANITSGALPSLTALLKVQQNLLDGTFTRTDVDNIVAVPRASQHLDNIDKCMPIYEEWQLSGGGMGGRLKNMLCLAAACCQPDFEAWIECNKHNCLKGKDNQLDPPTEADVQRALEQCGAVKKRLERCTARAAQEVLAASLTPDLFGAGGAARHHVRIGAVGGGAAGGKGAGYASPRTAARDFLAGRRRARQAAATKAQQA